MRPGEAKSSLRTAALAWPVGAAGQAAAGVGLYQARDSACAQPLNRPRGYWLVSSHM